MESDRLKQLASNNVGRNAIDKDKNKDNYKDKDKDKGRHEDFQNRIIDDRPEQDKKEKYNQNKQESVESHSSPTVKKINYESVSYRKDNLKLVKADFRWGVLSIKNESPYKWQFKAEKVKKGYAYYLVYFYKDSETYYSNVIDAEVVSGNQSVTMPSLTKYSTFLSQLLLLEMRDNPEVVNDKYWRQDIEEIFSRPFFEAMDYKDMANLIKTFKQKNPIFKFNRKFEQELLKLMKIVLLDSDARYEALDYVKKLPKQIVNDDARDILTKNIRSFVNKRLEEEEEEDYYYDQDGNFSDESGGVKNSGSDAKKEDDFLDESKLVGEDGL